MAVNVEQKLYPNPEDLAARLVVLIAAGSTINHVIVTHLKPVYIIIHTN